ncbi:MAG: hypothetical protein HY907_15985 [Deltaproteobacteria bacterium]|nr:hypothetical protein [Deltaproteobacteria bacterium]
MESVPPVSVAAAPGPRRARAAAAEPAEGPPADEVARAAGVARPASWLGAPLYAWQALRRLPALRAEVAARSEEARQSEKFRREAFAAWARGHGREMGAEAALKPFVEAVLRANKTLQGFTEGHAADFERFRKLDGAIADETKAAEAQKESLTGSLGTAEADWRQRSETLFRAKAKLRRGEIEVRNLEQIAEGKVGPGSPHHGRFVELQGARATAQGELAQAESEERGAKAEVARIRAELLDIDRRLDARREAARNDPVRRRVEEGHDAHRLALEEALSAAAAQAIARRLVPADSPDAQRLGALREAEEAAKRAHGIHQAALESIDRTSIAIGLAIPAGLVVVLFALLVVLR